MARHIIMDQRRLPGKCTSEVSRISTIDRPHKKGKFTWRSGRPMGGGLKAKRMDLTNPRDRRKKKNTHMNKPRVQGRFHLSREGSDKS